MMKKFFGFTMMMLLVILFSGCSDRSQSVDTETSKDVAPTATSIPTAAPTLIHVPTTAPTSEPVYSVDWTVYTEEENESEPTPAIPEEPDWSNMQEALKIHDTNPSQRSIYATYINNGLKVEIGIDELSRTFKRCENDDEWTEYNIDTLFLPFEYEILMNFSTSNLGGFSIVLDKTTQEVVCVRFSEEIGNRTKVPSEVLKAFLTEDNHLAYQPYLVENSDGISFNIMLIEDNVEKLSGMSKLFSSIPKYDREKKSLSIKVFDSESEELGNIYSRKDGSLFTVINTNVIDWVYTNSALLLPYVSEELEIEKRDFYWDDLSSFTIFGKQYEYSYVDCISKIDETHEVVVSFWVGAT